MTLEDRRAELAAKGAMGCRMKQIETQLAKREEGTRESGSRLVRRSHLIG